MLPIFFPLRVAPTSIDNDLKGHQIEKPSKLNYANMSVFYNCQIMMLQILSGLQYFELSIHFFMNLQIHFFNEDHGKWECIPVGVKSYLIVSYQDLIIN